MNYCVKGKPHIRKTKNEFSVNIHLIVKLLALTFVREKLQAIVNTVNRNRFHNSSVQGSKQ